MIFILRLMKCINRLIEPFKLNIKNNILFNLVQSESGIKFKLS